MANTYTYQVPGAALQYNSTSTASIQQAAGATEGLTKKTSGFAKATAQLQAIMDFAGGPWGKLASAFIDAEVAAFKSYAATEQFNNSVQALAATDLQAKINMAYVNDEVYRLGLNLDSARANFINFSMAMVGSKLESEKANTVFSQVSEAARVMGLSGEQTGAALKVIGDAAHDGKLSVEELMRIEEVLPGTTRELALGMGKSYAQLSEEIRKGTYNSGELLTALGNQMHKTYGEAFTAASTSVNANLERMGSEWDRAKSIIGGAQSGILNTTTKFFADMMNKANNHADKANFIIEALDKTGGSTWDYKLGWDANRKEMEDVADISRGALTRAAKSPADALREVKYLQKVSNYKQSQAEEEMPILGFEEQTALQHKVNNSKHILTYTMSLIQKSAQQQQQKQKDDATLGNISDLYEPGKGLSNQTTTVTSGNAPRTNSYIGSPTESSAPKAQNINITIGKLADITLQTTNVSEGAMEIREILSKELLEVLNDANQMSDR